MQESARDRADAGDRAATLNEQIAQGHEWAADGKLGGNSDLHNEAATRYRRVAGQGRSDAQAARDGTDEPAD
jgi:hypothetical protein